MNPAPPPAKEWTLGEHLSFVYRLRREEAENAGTLVLLHGSGVDETSMMPLAADIAPRSTLVAVRGRITQDGDRRWFTRLTPVDFDQRSILAEVAAFAGFLAELGKAEAFDPRETVFLGYSNGANLLSSLMLLRPGLVRRAVLLRAMPVLHAPPQSDLSGARILLIAGAADVTYGPYAPALVSLLAARGAAVDARIIPAGHEFGAEDARIVREWLARPPA